MEMEVLLNIQKGDVFKCFEEAEQKITESARENFVQFYKRESRTISSGAKKTKRYLNPELKFYQVEWACVHGGRNFVCRSNGIRKSSTLKNEVPCAAHIRMKVSPKGDDFIIVSVNSRHNHLVSESYFNQLPHQRKLPPIIRKEAKKYLDMQVNKHFLKDKIEKKYNRQISMKCLGNIQNQDRVRKKFLSPQAKHKLLSTKLETAASLGSQACGENFNKVSSLFDDIIKMLENKIYKFDFTYEKKIDNKGIVVDESSKNNNIDISIEDDIEYYIPNDDSSDKTHVYSNINVVSIETVETETFNQDDSNDAIVDSSNTDLNATDDDTVFNIDTSESNNFENDYVETETFNHDNNDVIVVESDTENTDFDVTECPDTY